MWYTSHTVPNGQAWSLAWRSSLEASHPSADSHTTYHPRASQSPNTAVAYGFLHGLVHFRAHIRFTMEVLLRDPGKK